MKKQNKNKTKGQVMAIAGLFMILVNNYTGNFLQNFK